MEGERKNYLNLYVLALFLILSPFATTLSAWVIPNKAIAQLKDNANSGFQFQQATIGKLNSTSTIREAAALSNKGISLYSLGKYNESLIYFNKALAIDLASIDALYYKGVALYSFDKAKDAIAFYDEANMFADKALALNPNNADAVSIKALALSHTGRYNESLPYLDKALSIDPNNIYALGGKGLSLLQLGKYNESLPYLDKALAIDPIYLGALSNKAADLGELGKPIESLVFSDKALSINPNDVAALNNKAAALNSLGKYNESLVVSDKALSINPNHLVALNDKGFSLNNLGKYNESIIFFDKALSLDPKDIYALKERGAALQHLNQTTTAEATPLSNSSLNQGANFSQYLSPSFGFNILYPSNATANETQDGVSFRFANSSALVKLSVGYNPSSSNVTLTQYTDEKNKLLNHNFPDAQNIKTVEGHLSGYPAHFVTFDSDGKSIFSVWTVTGNKEYTIVGVTNQTANATNTFVPLLIKMVNSFSINQHR